MKQRTEWRVVLGLWLSLGGAIAPVAVAQFNLPVEVPVPEQIDPALPETVKTAVLQQAAAQTGLAPQQLILRQAIARTWSDGCLGLGPVGQMCTAVLVRGWEVRVAYQRQEWVYRTNASGEVVRYDPAGARLSRQITPPAEKIPPDQLPAKAPRNLVFREIRTGGLAGVKESITLEKNGRLMRQDLRATPPVTTVLKTLSTAEVKAFKKLLRDTYFGQFDGLRYPPPARAADFFTAALGTRQTTVQVADVNEADLPKDLQTVLQAWRTVQR